MKKNYKIAFFMVLMVTMLAINTTYADTPISGPDTIDTPGKYYLNNSISHNMGNIIVITSDNVTLDGKGLTIDGKNSAASTGVLVYKSGVVLKNVTIKNLNVKDFMEEGIYLQKCDDSIVFNSTTSNCGFGIRVQGINNTILNNTAHNNWNGIILWYTTNSTIKSNEIYSNNGIGFYTMQSTGNEVFNNSIYLNNQYGAYLESSNGNLIYDNFFNNSMYNIDAYQCTNDLNTTKENGGGNYWFNSTGPGFSETHPDNNGDGFCDDIHSIKAGLIDYLPKCMDTTGPVMTVHSPANKSILNVKNFIVNITAVDASGVDYIVSGLDDWNVSLAEYPNYFYLGYNGILDGNYSLTFYAFDNLGHRSVKKQWIVVNTEAPEIIINNPINNTSYNTRDILININATDAIGIKEVKVNINGTNETLSKTGDYYTLSKTLSDGKHSLKVYAEDNLGIKNVNEITFMVDTTKPNVSLNTPINNKTYSKNYMLINATVNDTYGIKEVKAIINGTNYTMNKDNDYYIVSKTLSDGKHGLKVYAEDNAGNKNVTDEIIFSVDTTKPGITVNSPVNNKIYNLSEVKVNFTVNESVSSSTVIIDRGTGDEKTVTVNPTDLTYTGTASGLKEGLHNINISVKDTAGNSDEKVISFIVDTTAPNVSINTPINNKIYNISDIVINATANDSSAIKEVIANINGTNVTLSKTDNYYTLSRNFADNKYVIKVYAEDTVGNKNVTDEVIFAVDTTAPKIITVKPTDSSTVGIATNIQVTVNEKSTVNISLTKGTETFKYDLTEDLHNENLHTKLISNLEAGTYTLKVTATDLYKNTYTNESTFIVDETKPVMEIAEPTNNSIYNKSDIEINATVTDTYGIKEVKANIKSSAVNKNVTLSKDTDNYIGNTNTLAEGDYNITIYATNNLGNINKTQPNEIIIDLTKPVITNEKPNRTIVNTGFTINATVTDNREVKNVTVELNENNYTMNDIGGNIYSTSAINSLSSGNYTYVITAYDKAGNYNKTKVINFTLDSSAPTITLNSPIGIQNESDITINATVIDKTGIKEVKANINGENNTLTLTDGYYIIDKTLSDNNYNLTIYAIDTLNNKAISSTTTFIVDTTAPNVSINTPTGTLKTNKFLINVSSLDSGSKVKEVKANITNGNINENVTLTKTGDYYVAEKTLNDGTYLLNVTSTDNANNSNSTTTTFTIDTHVPSNNNNRHRTIDASTSIDSKSLRRTVSDSNVVYGSSFDKQLAENLKENIHSDDTEIDGDTIIVGGPIANRIANQYNDRFSIPVTNDNPGENRGIIQVISIPSGSSTVIQNYKLIYIAGSDRLGTEAALKYFETLTELPEEPIIVEWTADGFRVVE
ncbi:parallel beta-helix repeat protein [Methanococcus voltae]|uniref:Ig-like domain-containing protein n=1 Tax=Methanococcus voltae TaxID=2188 RepID=UPI001AE40BDD|nr:Ig-like domain-containing protein [Methanococcus voltae]MBP2144466.1 parallel beta-helix repeat protein [Methanococcus voltae]